MLLHTFANGDQLHAYGFALVLDFAGPRNVLGTSMLLGGYRQDLRAVYNYDCHPGVGMAPEIDGASIEEHEAKIAAKLGLDPARSCGMETAVPMEHVSIQFARYEDMTVTAIVTAGVEVNGGRVGEAAGWHERGGLSVPANAADTGETAPTPGTINVMLHVNANLHPGCMASALMTLTEAKCAALQERVVPSRYSRGLATGTGTDSAIVIADAESSLALHYAGKHSKLGELIGRTVKRAIHESLEKQSGLSPDKQRSVLRRLERFGIDEDALYARYASEGRGPAISRAWFSAHVSALDVLPDAVAATACFVHLLDELEWGLLRAQDAAKTAARLAVALGDALGVEVGPTLAGTDSGDAVHALVDAWARILLQGVEARARV